MIEEELQQQRGRGRGVLALSCKCDDRPCMEMRGDGCKEGSKVEQEIAVSVEDSMELALSKATADLMSISSEFWNLAGIAS